MTYYKQQINAARGGKDLNIIERNIWHDSTLESWQREFLQRMIQQKHNIIKGGF